ncbi:hypothetical protein T484DRAFT_2710936 [Baffinella frigidus]|nr:hypothetical protein T484DRAFT_2710936 [Cryptophyta sp. CCMP2293]
MPHLSRFELGTSRLWCASLTTLATGARVGRAAGVSYVQKKSVSYVLTTVGFDEFEMVVEQVAVFGLGPGKVHSVVACHLFGHHTCAILQVPNPKP